MGHNLQGQFSPYQFLILFLIDKGLLNSVLSVVTFATVSGLLNRILSVPLLTDLTLG